MSVHNGLALKSAHGFDSDVGIAVKKATNEALTAPDWELITSICDLCRSSALCCENAVVSFVWRLKEPKEDVILLSLSLIDLCMKNCESTFPSCVNKVLMDEIVYIAVGGAGKGKLAEQLAQKLITEWGVKYEMKFKLPIFHDTYDNLVSKGMLSPRGKSSSSAPNPIPPHRTPSTPPSVTVGSEDGDTGPMPVISISHYDELSSLLEQNNGFLLKLERDLEVVVDKINLSKSIRKGLLTASPRRDNADSHEIAMDILDFLVACRNRLMDIIDSGAVGLLSSTCVTRCIAINEELSSEINEYEVCEEPNDVSDVDPPQGSLTVGGSRPAEFPAMPDTDTDTGATHLDSSSVPGVAALAAADSTSCLNSSFQEA